MVPPLTVVPHGVVVNPDEPQKRKQWREFAREKGGAGAAGQTTTESPSEQDKHTHQGSSARKK